jgi:hypothetical protein
MTNPIVTRWGDRIRQYNERNAGSPVNVELIRNNLTASTEARNLTLQGVDYDERAGRVDIMVSAGTEHLSHHVDHVKSVYMLIPSERGGDVLTIEHQGGQTILTAAHRPSCEVAWNL